MTRRMLWIPGAIALAVLGALMPSACSQASPCNASICSGCCDASGLCQGGGLVTECGSNGLQCVACQSGSACSQGVCVVGATGGGAATGGGTATGGGAATGGGGATGGGSAGVCTKTLVACSDKAIAELDLKTAASARLILNAADGAGWRSTIDAAAGGSTPSESYVYAKFTATGLARVSLGDQAAIDSMDWDIAFRRFVIRLNGGDSGPACTGAAALPAGVGFDSFTTPPSGAIYAPDDFLDKPSAGCAFIDDGSGLNTSPATALAPFYEYSGCVQMSGRVFAIETSARRHVKLVVETYYSTEAEQTACNGGSPISGAIGGTVRVRWAFLD